MSTTNATQKTISDVLDDDDRPDDCECDADTLDVACFACYRDGFDFDDPAPVEVA